MKRKEKNFKTVNSMIKQKLLINLFILLVIAASCKVGPNYTKDEFESPDKFRAALADGDTVAIDTTSILKWWELFDDPVLDTLIVHALEQNQDALIAAKRIQRAQAQLSSQKADMWPKINAQGGYTYGNYSGFLNSEAQGAWNAAAVMQWEIDFWGKFRRLNEAALAEYLGSEYALRTVQLELISQVAKTYFSLLENESRLNIANRTLESRDSSLVIIEKRFEQGIIPEIDVNQAQIQRAIAASAVPVFDRYYRQTENTLAVLIGEMPRSFEIGKPLDEQNFEIEIPAGLPSQLLVRRPDVNNVEQQLIAQNARIGAAQAMRLPAISLTGLFGAASNDLGLASPNSFAWNAGGSLLSPIFHFGKNKRRVEIERIKTEEVRLEYEKTVLVAFKEVENTLIEISTLKEELVARQAHVDAAKNAEKLSKLRYDRGVTSYLEFLEAQRQSFEAQNFLAESKQKLLTAYILLYKALGGGWISEAEEQAANEPNQE